MIPGCCSARRVQQRVVSHSKMARLHVENVPNRGLKAPHSQLNFLTSAPWVTAHAGMATTEAAVSADAVKARLVEVLHAQEATVLDTSGG